MRGRLWFVVSLSRAGKTSWCQSWAQEKPGRVVVSGDSFRTAIHGQAFIPEAEGLVFASMDVAIRALLLSGFDVVVDETSTTKATILRYLRIDIDARPVFITADAQVCQERAIRDGKAYLVKPIARMSKQLKKLTKNWPKKLQEMRDYVTMRREQDVRV